MPPSCRLVMGLCSVPAVHLETGSSSTKLMALDMRRFPLSCILTNKDERAGKEIEAEGVRQQFFHLTAPLAEPADLTQCSGGRCSSPRASPMREQSRQIQHLSEASFDGIPSFLAAVWPIRIYHIINVWCRIAL